MDFLPSLLISLVLLAAAAGLLVWHVCSWRAVQGEEVEPRELDYRRRQYRRRMQTSAMLGVLGVAILAGQVLTPRLQSRSFAGIYWSGVLILVAWMGLLAIADIVATHYHFSRLRTDYLIERTKLQAQVRIERAKLQAQVRQIKARSNGKTEPSEDPGSGPNPAKHD
jgi:hypothetical protein